MKLESKDLDDPARPSDDPLVPREAHADGQCHRAGEVNQRLDDIAAVVERRFLDGEQDVVQSRCYFHLGRCTWARTCLYYLSVPLFAGIERAKH